MRRVILGVLVLGGLMVGGEAPAAPPNIVLIVSDDQGWGDFGFMGHPEIRTPRLDRLASQSLVYRRGYVTTSLCCPSLAAILTGRYPHETGVTGNEPPAPAGMAAGKRYSDPGFLAQVNEVNGYMAKFPRIPSELGKAGYVSFQTGKWWAGSYRTGGFTAGMSHGDQAKGGRHGDEGLAIGRQTMQPITDFMSRAQAEGKPFFVWYAPMMPHLAHNPPERLLAKYRGRTPSIRVARYWAMCEWFDETCGALLDHLDASGLSDNTIVAFVVDNGWVQDSKSDVPVASKNTAYDAGLRTPILLRWPGHIAPRVDDTPVSSIDLAPTLYRAVGVPVPEGLPGVDLLDAKAVAARPAVFGAVFLHSAVDIHDPAKNLTWRWCVAGDWKLIVPNPANIKEAPRKGQAVDAVELYDVGADPLETKNLAGAEPGRVEELRKQLDGWWRP